MPVWGQFAGGPEAEGGVSRDDPDRFLRLPASGFYRDLVCLHDLIMWEAVQFWHGLGLRYSFLPMTTNAASSPMGLGSDSSPVRVNLAGLDTYLADSMQFFLEYVCRFGGPGAFYVMPSFRGEAADSTHLGQFMHLEAEICGGLDDVIAVVQRFLVHLASRVMEHVGTFSSALLAGTAHLASLVARDEGGFVRLTFDDAAAVLDGDPRYIREVARDARTLTRAGEHELLRRAGAFVWVTHWDHLAVPFYQRLLSGERPRAANADLLFGPGEVVGAGERHATGVAIREALTLHQVAARDYEWYVAMKDTYPMPTAGFGIGIERLLMWLTGHDDIRDLQLLVRDNGVPYVP